MFSFLVPLGVFAALVKRFVILQAMSNAKRRGFQLLSMMRLDVVNFTLLELLPNQLDSLMTCEAAPEVPLFSHRVVLYSIDDTATFLFDFSTHRKLLCTD